MNQLSDTLESVARVLSRGRFDVDRLDLRGLGTCLLAETPHALVLCLVGDWDTLAATVDEAQAILTNLAAQHPSPRSWDLYLVVCVQRTANEAQELLREDLEHDTRYARKFVLAGRPAEDAAVERALRPLLPLRQAPSMELTDPLESVRSELLAHGADPDLVDKAMKSYRATGDIKIA
jgi:hypothetical protein